jgi:hypothetical protein
MRLETGVSFVHLMSQLFLFIDTNTFLHYKPIDQIDWLKIADTEQLTLIITPVVVRELNKHKDFPRSSKIRDRASGSLKRLHDWSEAPAPIKIRKNVELRFQVHDPLIDFAASNLSRDIADDHLIACMLEHRSKYDGISTYILTEDLGLKLKAKACGLLVIQLPPELRLPDEVLGDEKKVRELESQLNRLQMRLPVLTLRFASQGGQCDVTLNDAGTLSPEAVEEQIAYLKLKNPPMKAQVRPDPSEDRLAMLAFTASVINEIPDKDIKEYNEKLAQYFSEYADYLSKQQEYRSLSALTVELRIVLANEGTSPAEDVDVFMHFPDGFDLVSEDDLPVEPEAPTPPRRPRGVLEWMSDTRLASSFYPDSALMDYYTSQPPSLMARNVSGPKIRRTNSYDVTVRIGKAKHNQMSELDPLYVIFDSLDDACSFGIDYQIHAANLPDPVAGTLHVVLTKPQE